MTQETRRHTVYVENGSIYSSLSGAIVEKPAILLDKTSGTMHKWGEAGTVRAIYETMSDRMNKAGIEHGLMLVEMDETSMSRDEQAYVINRCVEYTASGFQIKLCEHLERGDALEWLRSEIIRVPI